MSFVHAHVQGLSGVLVLENILDREFAQHNIDHADLSWLLAAPEEQQPTA